ncbi:MAG: exodeoxyribonuclease VII small subunit [Opitutales bacterium]|nr:exodeoxyribonuclease VII small subunit [Opitutales bacterium]
MKKEPTFEEAFAALQNILRELGGQGVALDQLVKKYSEAKECLEICRKRLSEAEMQVKQLGENGLADFDE